METALPYGGGTVELKFLLLPEKDDPDTFVRSRGADAFRALAAGAVPLPDFLVKELDERVDFGTVGGRARFEAVAKPLLRRLPEGSYRADDHGDVRAANWACERPCSTSLMVDAPAAVVAKPSQPTPGIKRKTAVQKVINLALHYPRAAAQVARRRAARGPDPARRGRAAPRLRRGRRGSATRIPRCYWKTCAATPISSTSSESCAEPPLGIDDEAAAATELKESLENLRKDALKIGQCREDQGPQAGGRDRIARLGSRGTETSAHGTMP